MSAFVEQVRGAFQAHRKLRIRGAGTWMDAGRPAAASESLSLAEHRGIVEYVPGDLTLTARAGTTIAEIRAATTPNGQWLPLDPWGGDAGTIGATVSTGTSGPHAYAMGLPRDVVLGMEFVTGSGAVIRAGGRVVKNVAGFDLSRLLVGSWGTLGVITEVTVRLRARPDRTQTLALSVGTSAQVLNDVAMRLRALPFAPLASELIDAALATHLGLGSVSVLLCRLGGNEKSLQGQLDIVRALGGQATELEEDVWDRLRTLDAGMSAAWRWSQVPTRFGVTWQAAERASDDLDTFAHGNPARGVVRVVARGESARLATAATSFDGTAIVEKLPADCWSRVATSAGDPLSRSLRDKFNPRGVLNAGILGDAS